MANTYSLIASNVFSSAANQLTFSSIPQTYTDLVLRISARQSSGNPNVYGRLNVFFNSDDDTSVDYSNTRLYTLNGTSATSDRLSSTYFGPEMWSAGNSTANTFGNGEIYIPNYTTTEAKPTSSFGVGENNATANAIGISAGLKRANISAISSLRIVSSINFDIGSSFYLYGIKKN